MAYLSYTCAEVFHFSGIVSIIGCGLVQAHYAFKNISKKSYTTVKYFTKTIRSGSLTFSTYFYLFSFGYMGDVKNAFSKLFAFLVRIDTNTLKVYESKSILKSPKHT